MKVLIWHLEELVWVEPGGGGAWRRRGLSRIAVCADDVTVNQSQEGR